MRKAIVSSIMIVALAVAAGCSRENIEYGSGHSASLSLSISSEGEFTTVDDGAGTMTKADEETTVDINAFTLKILNSEGVADWSWDRFDEVPEVISMDPGTYTIEARSPGDKAVSWDQPMYVGSQEVIITPGNVEEVSIVCSLSNMKVSVQTTEKFRNEMAEYTVTVTSEDGVLIFGKEEIEAGRSGYFDVAPLSMDLTAVRQTGGPRVNYHVEISDVAPRDHHVFTLDAAETGYTDLAQGLSIDNTCNNREEAIKVDAILEEPVDGLTVPEVTSSSIENGERNVPANTSILVLTWSTVTEVSASAQITLNDTPCMATASNNMVSVILPDMAEDTEYTLNVPAGAVLNAVTADPCEAYSLTFTTAGGQETEPDITISATAGIDAPVTYSKSALPEEFSLSVEAPAGIANYVVNVKSAGLQGLLDMMQMRYSVDLANMNDKETEFWGNLFGITSADIKGKTGVSFKIASFLSAMPNETNELEVVITDGNGDKLSKTLTIIMTE